MKTMKREHIIASTNLVTILGLTFKENVADLRNSQVQNIVEELSSYGFELQLHDPIVDKQQASTLFGHAVSDFHDLKPSGAVVIAVAHDAYKKMNWSDYISLFGDSGVLFDVKGILPRDGIPQHLILMRL